MVTAEQFVSGYERSVENLPGVLDEWATLDEELVMEYRDQLEWLIRNRFQFLDRTDVGPRLREAHRKLTLLGDRIREVMGVEVV
jgi:hypothetical protein